MPHRRQNSMVRIFTSFIFGVTIVPSPCSRSVQAMPRQPSSPARASPTGPPPTIRTGVRIRGACSVDLDVGLLAEAAPLREVRRDGGGKLLGRARLRQRADLAQRVPDLG